MVSFTDERIKATYVDYDSPGGNGEKIRGYLVLDPQSYSGLITITKGK